MYEYRDGYYRRLRADIQKSIRIDRETYEIIDSFEGRNFSDKIRKMAREFKKLKNNNPDGL